VYQQAGYRREVHKWGSEENVKLNSTYTCPILGFLRIYSVKWEGKWGILERGQGKRERTQHILHSNELYLTTILYRCDQFPKKRGSLKQYQAITSKLFV
jgi:hypothetical protein